MYICCEILVVVIEANNTMNFLFCDHTFTPKWQCFKSKFK